MDSFSQNALVALTLLELVSAAPIPAFSRGLAPTSEHNLLKAFGHFKLPDFLQARSLAIKLGLSQPPPPTGKRTLMLKTVKGNVYSKAHRKLMKRAAQEAFSFRSLFSPHSRYFGVTIAATVIIGIALCCFIIWCLKRLAHMKQNDDDAPLLRSPRRRYASSIQKLPTISEIDDFYPSEKDRTSLQFSDSKHFSLPLFPFEDPVPAYSERTRPSLDLERPVKRPAQSHKPTSRSISGLKSVSSSHIRSKDLKRQGRDRQLASLGIDSHSSCSCSHSGRSSGKRSSYKRVTTA